jgi:Mg-chelatase subunit ChlD
VVFLTDGKANMMRSGKARIRRPPERESAAAARIFRAGGTTAVVVDTLTAPAAALGAARA